ncbi:hypothetical protein [Marimonas arenosa]|uniref:Uncharacterized protein n=1 Tax=Marimonas arenosa TaxID=1795305 RepID=A0AAE3W9R4_9RHOB|nr:hypothetical protein [Marimonas arenosa]MDQ2088824.1 hypothetical protein [Marimonas arenosa]
MSASSFINADVTVTAPQDVDRVFVVVPSRLGIGEDMIIGGPCGPVYRKIDLSRLSDPVDIVWTGENSGLITDGADSIVFQGVDEIILPACMKPVPHQDNVIAMTSVA